MAQLRQDFNLFTALDTVILVLGPEGLDAFRAYWAKEDLPFIGLPDPQRTVLNLYGQQVNWFKLGRMPAQVLVDQSGIARFAHYGDSMSDIPNNADLLALLKSFGEA